MNSQTINSQSPFQQRFTYWATERFPFFNIIVAFVMAFSIKGLFTEGRFDWQINDIFLGILFLTMLFVLRVMDEHKDYESDKTFHPERAVQKGLITLSELRKCGYLALALQLFSLFLLSHTSKTLYAIWLFVLVWSLLMLKEFFIKSWLRSHLLTYSVLHLAISPFMFVTGWFYYSSHQGHFEWKKLALLMSLSFVTGLIFEIGRKNRSEAEDAKGEISFSRLWGRRMCRWILISLSTVSLVLGGAYVGFTNQISIFIFSLMGILILFSSFKNLVTFEKDPTEMNYKKARSFVELIVVWSFVGSFLIVLVRSYL